MKKKIGTFIILLVFACYVFILAISISPTKSLEQIPNYTTQKPTILFIVDSLMSEPLDKLVEQGAVPAFEFLIKN